MFTVVNNCYWITLFNVTYLEGNKFINGLILGISEIISGVFAGILINKTSAAMAFRICAVLSVSFNVLTQFVFPAGTIQCYISLFMAILGVGGVYTVMYVFIGLIIPIEQVGGATVLILTIATSLSLFAPLIVLLQGEISFLILTAMMAVGFILTFVLPQDKSEPLKEDQELKLINDWNRNRV